VNPWLLLLLAVGCEVVGTTALKASHGFRRLGPSLLTVAGYGPALFLLGLVFARLPLGVVYAVWSGLGIAAVTALGVVLFGERLTTSRLVGIGLIVGGTLILNLGTT